MKKSKLFYNLLILISLISSCNNSNSKKEGELELNKNQQTLSEELSNVTQVEKILYFEKQYGTNDNQKEIYKLIFTGNKVEIYYKNEEFDQDFENPPTKGELKDGIIYSPDGYTYFFNKNGLCEENPESGEIGCIPFIRAKSTNEIEEVINPEPPGYFKGQNLKSGEKIIKINWSKENKTNYTRDMNSSGFRYSSKLLKVPNGKKWILIYINEDFTFENGHVVGSVPDLFIDNKDEEINNRRFSNPKDINLSRAKDENIKIYSGSTIKAISSRTNGKGVGNNFIEYLGEMWFLEIND
ncbi:MAG: hypothetical protein ACH34V_10495 [Flavobacterium sp.]|uniref:hypothetical protein n=1 Tax=Flavobacterium sp. TaxID=239 RepID=UPI0037B91459